MYCEVFKTLKEYASLHPDLLESLTEKDLHALSNSGKAVMDARMSITPNALNLNRKHLNTHACHYMDTQYIHPDRSLEPV